MTSPGRGTDGANPQDSKTAIGKLSGSPKLTFTRDFTGDTVTRSAGTWDAGDGFSIGQRITITGALNAGNYTIANISEGGKTLVLDVRETVHELVTSALSIIGSPNKPTELSLAKIDDSLDAEKRTRDALPEDSPGKVDGSPGDGKSIKEAPLELLPIKSDNGPGAEKRTRKAPPEVAPGKNDGSHGDGKPIKEAPLELLPMESDDSPGTGEQTSGVPAKEAPIKSDDSAGAGKKTTEGPAKIAPTKVDAGRAPKERMKAAPTKTAPLAKSDSSSAAEEKIQSPPTKAPLGKNDKNSDSGKRMEAAQTKSPPSEDETSPGAGKKTTEAPAKVAPTKSDSSPAPSEKMNAAPAKTARPRDDETSPDASRRATDAPGRAIRSGIEIRKMLEAICEEELAVTAYPDKGELLFVSRMRAVDPDLGRIIIEYSQWKPANSALLVCEQVLFHVERKNRHIQFLTTLPKEVVFGGSAGIQVVFPQFVLDLQQRAHRRFSVKSLPSLWCVIKREGFDPIVANVTDISRGGLGGIVHDPGIVLKPGTIIKECQITGTSLKRPVDVSVEVRHWKTIRAQDGTLSKRVGCRFVASSLNLQQLIDVFEIQLDEAGPED